MTEILDSVAQYGMALGFDVRPRTVLVEGTTDVLLFELAARFRLTLRCSLEVPPVSNKVLPATR